LFGIGKKADEFEIVDKEAAVKVFDGLIQMKKERRGVFITTQTLEALKQYFLTGQRTWRCQALSSFVMVDSLGRVAGCHRNEPVSQVLELKDAWDSPKLEDLRKKYNDCSQCTYLCYIFYSIHGSIASNLGIVWDQWKNVGSFLTRTRQQH
jgi:MoaA/NifB/PqqE/SkfB family radical SAM enzyme